MKEFVSRDGKSLLWRKDRENLRIIPWGQNGVRVQAGMEPRFPDLPNALLDSPPAKGDSKITIEKDRAVLQNGKITVQLLKNGRLIFRRTSTGEILLEEWETANSRYKAREFKAYRNAYQIQLRFKAREGERFYGLGQHQHGFLNQKGCVIELEQRNTEVSVPFLVSSLGYGLLWNHPGTGRVELARSATRWVADSARQMDFYLTAGDSLSEVMNQYAGATGYPRQFPVWASGFWQCKLRYETQDELLHVAREYKKRGLPISVIVIDYYHWTKMGEWKFEPSQWPDPAKMVNELKKMGIELMVSLWPTVNPFSENWDYMFSHGLLVANDRGTPAHFRFPDGEEHMEYLTYYDAMNPAARAFVWDKIRRNYYKHGVKLFWLDSCEPETNPPDQENMRYHLGNGAEVACLYPFMHQRGIFEGLKSAGETEILTLCRSAWAGSQRYGAAVWSGDIQSSFDAFRRQIPAGLNMGLSGIPWWTTDIGGFFGGKPDDPVFRELLVRWFQYAVFCPIFRLHGIREPRKGEKFAPNEVWSYGDKVYDILKEQLFLRERLRTYVMKQMRTAEKKGTPPMRPLFFDFPSDPAAWEIEDEFMFGPDILVAPVAEHGGRKRNVYLPAGTEWYDAWTGKRHSGGRLFSSPAPLERIPVYIKNGKKALMSIFSSFRIPENQQEIKS